MFTVDWGNRPCRVCTQEVNYFGATCDSCWKPYCHDTCGVTFAVQDGTGLKVHRVCLDCMYGRDYGDR